MHDVWRGPRRLGHFPDHPQRPDGGLRTPTSLAGTPAEKAFLALGPGAPAWLVEAGAVGASRVWAKMVDAVELAALFGVDAVDAPGAGSAGSAGAGDELATAASSGTGKSRFVEAIAHKAIDAEMRVAWFALVSLTATAGQTAGEAFYRLIDTPWLRGSTGLG